VSAALQVAPSPTARWTVADYAAWLAAGGRPRPPFRNDSLVCWHARRILENCGLWRPRPAEDLSPDADLARVEVLAAMIAALTAEKPEQRAQIVKLLIEA
jgi:hypothetical protein